MRIVVIESPFAGDVPRNLRYLRACLRDSLLRDEAPYASHALYTQPGVLDDGDPDDRKRGMEAGFRFKKFADATIVYTDLGISAGMQAGIDASIAQGFTYEYRDLGEDWETHAETVEGTFKTRWPEDGIDVAAYETLKGAYDLAVETGVDEMLTVLRATLVERDGVHEGEEAIAIGGFANGDTHVTVVKRSEATADKLDDARESVARRMLRAILVERGPVV